MVQRGEDLRLALEAREAVGVVRKGRGQDLQRDVAMELGVAGMVHLTHATGAERRQQFIGTQARAGD
jgi:hypothetical protein